MTTFKPESRHTNARLILEGQCILFVPFCHFELSIFYLQLNVLLVGLLPDSFPDGSVVKNPPAKQETQVRSLGQEDCLEKEMATHPSILAWEIPWTEETVKLPSMG